MNKDWADLLQLFGKHQVEYVVVGGVAAQFHGVQNTPGDLDLYVRPTEENGARVLTAFREGGFPTYGQTPKDFTDEHMVLRLGAASRDPRVPSNYVDIHTSIKGIPFESAHRAHLEVTVSEIPVKVMSRPHLIISKREAGRPKDLEHLRKLDAVSRFRQREVSKTRGRGREFDE